MVTNKVRGAHLGRYGYIAYRLIHSKGNFRCGRSIAIDHGLQYILCANGITEILGQPILIGRKSRYGLRIRAKRYDIGIIKIDKAEVSYSHL